MDKVEVVADAAEVVEPGVSGGPAEPHHHRHRNAGIRRCSPDSRARQRLQEVQSNMVTHILHSDHHQKYPPHISTVAQWPLEWPCQWCHTLKAGDLLDGDPPVPTRDRRLQNMTYEEELHSTQPIFNPDEDVSVDTLKNLEVNEVAQGENEMKIDVISDKLEKPQIESEEDQPLIFYTADTFMLDDPNATDFFVLEVPNELLNLKEGMHASLLKYVDVSFVVDISKGEGIT
ncbi:hypothetical protein Scep_002065 [Stephania cephalantha]|uniref:Uncharacterized protein n=1 Tax=Stephania cephalantha TaxID=152367 RepID=A0AAP0LD88_9MAGN